MKWKEWCPFLTWWQGPAVLRTDVLAGLTVGLVLVPQSMAYADLAGMSPVTGLYAATIPMILGALFGRCAQLNTGPVAMTSLLTAATVGAFVAANEGIAPEQYPALVALLAILVGVVRLVFGALKMAHLVQLISNPAVIGFAAAGGIVIATTQVPKFFGVETQERNPFALALELVTNLGAIHLPTLVMGLGSLGLMIGFKRWLPKWPGLLIALVAATVTSWLLDYQAMGGTVVGAIPSGLPEISLPAMDTSLVVALLPGAVLVTVIGFLEVLAVTSAAGAKTKQRIDLNGELIGQGAASLGAGLVGGFPVSGSLSRSSLNLISGAQTALSSVVSAVLVIIVLLVATRPLYFLPMSSLAAVIVIAVSSLIKPSLIRRAWQVSWHDGMAASITLLMTLILAPNMVDGMMIGAGSALVLFIIRTMRPRCTQLARDDYGNWRGIDKHDLTASTTVPVIRFDGRLYFANAGTLESKVLRILADTPQAQAVVIAGGGINDLDATGEQALARLHRELKENDVQLYLAELKEQIMAVLKRSGLHQELGEEAFAPTIDLAYRRASEGRQQQEYTADFVI